MPAEPRRGPAAKVRPQRAVVHNLGEAAEQFASCGLKVALLPRGNPSGRIDFSAVTWASEGMVFMRVAFEEPVEIRHLESFEGYQLLVPLSGVTSVDLGERVIDCAKPQAAIFNLDDLKSAHCSARSENYAIFISQRALTGRLFELTGAPVTRKLRFEPEFDLSEAPIEALQGFLTALDRVMLVQALQNAPHSAKRLAALLIDLVLELLPHNYQDAFDRGPSLIAPKHVKRTVEFIQANARRPISAEELAEVSGVSLRALQYGFQKFLGVSISDYERSVRLERVRREIESDPAEQVGVVARRWGFSNFTRFNAQFEAAFGLTAVALRTQLGQRTQGRRGAR